MLIAVVIVIVFKGDKMSKELKIALTSFSVAIFYVATIATIATMGIITTKTFILFYIVSFGIIGLGASYFARSKEYIEQRR